ncbi:MAG TPA: hypothetical protein VG325_18190 [Solirubrobacteraceae bacterium]|nr:hypothetical protein [Solirubrobacteraceae bacterium]
MNAESFQQTVAATAGISREEAERAVRATLRAIEGVPETLAELISEGEVEDLLARLPRDLIPPRKRGLATH